MRTSNKCGPQLQRYASWFQLLGMPSMWRALWHVLVRERPSPSQPLSGLSHRFALVASVWMAVWALQVGMHAALSACTGCCELWAAGRGLDQRRVMAPLRPHSSSCGECRIEGRLTAVIRATVAVALSSVYGRAHRAHLRLLGGCMLLMHSMYMVLGYGWGGQAGPSAAACITQTSDTNRRARHVCEHSNMCACLFRAFM